MSCVIDIIETDCKFNVVLMLSLFGLITETVKPFSIAFNKFRVEPLYTDIATGPEPVIVKSLTVAIELFTFKIL